MTNKFVFGFLLITILLSTFAVMVISHEATHYLLGETTKGICFGNCDGQALTFGAVYGIDNQSLGCSEPLAWGIGLVCAIIFFGVWNYILFKR